MAVLRSLFVRGLLCALMISVAVRCRAQQNPDLAEMTLEDLLNVQVVTASKKEQPLARTAAAVYVITAEEIARSGLTSIREVLRLAPGVQVAAIDSSTWAISIRGFNSEFSNKLLVLVDGRTVYSPSFSGVFWNVEDIPINEIERIEVVRGPGAAVWGANAVNGVINIITKKAGDTQGGLLTLGGGSYELASGGLRYGWKQGAAAFRISTHYVDLGPLATPNGESNHDGWDLQRIGFRGDIPHATDTWTIEGDLYQSNASDNIPVPLLTAPYVGVRPTSYYYSGASVLLRWHRTRNGIESSWQAFYSRAHSAGSAYFGLTDHTVDFDVEQRIPLQTRQQLVWGVGFRVLDENTNPSFDLSFTPNSRKLKVFSGFLQDEITLIHERLWLTLGSKYEHNDFTGSEAEPDIRLLWTVRPHHVLWGAVSRAIRSPSVYEEAGRISLAVPTGPAPVPVVVAGFGNANFRSEKLIAYELGYRVQANRRTSFDLASFFNSYRDIASIDFGQPFLEFQPQPVHLVVPAELGNQLHGHTYGAELTGAFSATRRWKLTATYSLIRFSVRQNASGPDAAPVQSDGSPEHQVQAHSILSLPHRLQLDTSVYHFTAFPQQPVPAHTRLDVHLGWSFGERLRLNAGLQDLLSPRHLEFTEPNGLTAPAEMPRSFYGRASWTF